MTAKSDSRDVVEELDAGGDDYLTKPFEHSALLAKVRSMLRQKALYDTVQEQATMLASLNRSLEERVAAQVAEIERINRLRRFLPEQVTNLIVASGEESELLKSHRREVTVVFCRATFRLRGDRYGAKSRCSPMRESKGRANLDKPAGLRSARETDTLPFCRGAAAQGILPADDYV